MKSLEEEILSTKKQTEKHALEKEKLLIDKVYIFFPLMQTSS